MREDAGSPTGKPALQDYDYDYDYDYEQIHCRPSFPRKRELGEDDEGMNERSKRHPAK